MRPSHSAIAGVGFAKGADIDGLLVDVVSTLVGAGVRLGGLLQLADGGEARRATSVKVVDLHTGDRYEIWEPRGHWARGCRLDETELARAEAAVLKSLDAGIDLIVLNRFGRAESKGRGLVTCFIHAMSVGVPILTAVREPFDAEWDRFHGGLGMTLPPEQHAILGWVDSVLGEIPAVVRDPVASAHI
jgi:hypothetical protein